MTALAAGTATHFSASAQEEARIAAVVNDSVVSFVDLANRTNLVLFATGLPATAESSQRLQPQILQTLINETLQMQEAEANNIKVRDREIESVIARMESENRLPPGGMDEFLTRKGIAPSALGQQVTASLAWTKLVERKLGPQAIVSEDEIDEAMRRLQENQGKPRSLVSQIFLSVDDSSQEERVRQSAARIAQQISQGASFAALARAFSQNAAAAAGGDLGWLAEGQLDPELENVLSRMQPGQIVGPVRMRDGYHILLLRDRRLPGGTAPNQITVDLRQINLSLPRLPSEADLRSALATSERIRAMVNDCATLARGGLPEGVSVVNVGRVRIGDLAAPLQAPLMGLDVNQITPPLRSQSGVTMLMVCGREAQADELPDRDQVRQRLVREKLDLLARRYLRDLRRAAFLDLRI